MSISAHPMQGRQRGVTLVELVLFIVVVSVAVAGILQVLQSSTAASADPLRRKQALMIAEALLEEVQLAQYTFCDPASPDASTATSTAACTIPERFGQESAGSRPYDNVNDYAAAANTPIAAFNAGGVLADANGVPMAVNGYSASLTLIPESLGDIASNAGAVDVGEVLRISVTVSYDNQKLVLDGYRTRYAPNTP